MGKVAFCSTIQHVAVLLRIHGIFVAWEELIPLDCTQSLEEETRRREEEAAAAQNADPMDSMDEADSARENFLTRLGLMLRSPVCGESV